MRKVTVESLNVKARKEFIRHATRDLDMERRIGMDSQEFWSAPDGRVVSFNALGGSTFLWDSTEAMVRYYSGEPPEGERDLSDSGDESGLFDGFGFSPPEVEAEIGALLGDLDLHDLDEPFSKKGLRTVSTRVRRVWPDTIFDDTDRRRLIVYVSETFRQALRGSIGRLG